MDKKTQQIVGAGAAVLVLIAGYMLMHKKPSVKTAINQNGATTDLTASVAASDVASSSTTGLPSASNIKANDVEGLSVADQAAGDTVALDGLNVTTHTWAVVYDENEGQPSWVMGAGLVWPGNGTFVVDLMRATKTGHKYYVALIKDDGSKKFDLRTVRPDASTVVASFITK